MKGERGGPSSGNVIDEEEYAILSRQQQERQAYKRLLEQKYVLDAEIVRDKLVEDFGVCRVI